MRKRKNKDGARLSQRVVRALDIPSDVLPSCVCTEMFDGHTVNIRGGGRILKYDREQVRVKTKDGYVYVCGRDLCCVAYSFGEVCIEGDIDCVGYGREGD